jgi:hypothetical protein
MWEGESGRETNCQCDGLSYYHIRSNSIGRAQGRLQLPSCCDVQDLFTPRSILTSHQQPVYPLVLAAKVMYKYFSSHITVYYFVS